MNVLFTVSGLYRDDLPAEQATRESAGARVFTTAPGNYGFAPTAS